MFRGREVAHPERGEALLMKLAEELEEYGAIEQKPSQEGRNMTMLLAPVRTSPNSKRERQQSNGAANAAAEPSAEQAT
jgi:translation initiation factor IF-3